MIKQAILFPGFILGKINGCIFYKRIKLLMFNKYYILTPIKNEQT